MPKGKNIGSLLRPLSEKPVQAYFGEGLHTLGLLRWILAQTGPADVMVSSYSTSEPFLNGCCILKDKGLIRQSMILLDQRAAAKTLRLERLLQGCFSHVFMGQNHSKILLVANARHRVAVVTSQNQTYGLRAESTIITTDMGVYDTLLSQFTYICGSHAVELDIANGKGIVTGMREAGQAAADAKPDIRPFGFEW